MAEDEEWGDADVAMDDGDDGWDDGGDDGWGDEQIVSAESFIPDEAPQPERLERQQTLVHSLEPGDIDRAIQKKIEIIKESIELPDEDCLLLLRNNKWNVTRVIDQYFSDPEGMQRDAGICMEPKEAPLFSGTIECQVCMDDVTHDKVFALACGHQTTCDSCWIDYLANAVKTKECVNLQCPAFKCHVVIPRADWERILSERPVEYERYRRFCRESFVEFSKEFAFCPGKSCEMIYSASAGVAKEVDCDKCKFIFCWACKNEHHLPSSCKMAEQWVQKNSSEAENIQWILAKTKRCPRCKVHIEKNQGCNHMTCRKAVGGCGHEFCWLCKGDWSAHGSSTGGYYQCNIYEKNKKDGKQMDEEKQQEDAKNELERYEFHFTRFDSHAKSAGHAREMKSKTHDKMHELSQKFQWRLNEANFLLDAVNEAIKCWHVLAWTYPIAYYFPTDSANLALFKQQQGQLETFCNGLQSKLDFDFEKLGQIKTRQEIIHYTRTSEQYRKNLVEYIENEIAF